MFEFLNRFRKKKVKERTFTPDLSRVVTGRVRSSAPALQNIPIKSDSGALIRSRMVDRVIVRDDENVLLQMMLMQAIMNSSQNSCDSVDMQNAALQNAAGETLVCNQGDFGGAGASMDYSSPSPSSDFNSSYDSGSSYSSSSDSSSYSSCDSSFDTGSCGGGSDY